MRALERESEWEQDRERKRGAQSTIILLRDKQTINQSIMFTRLCRALFFFMYRYEQT